MTNIERVQKANIKELAKIIKEEFCGMCHSCEYCYTPDCRYDEEANDVNQDACEKGIEKWLNKEFEKQN